PVGAVPVGRVVLLGGRRRSGTVSWVEPTPSPRAVPLFLPRGEGASTPVCTTARPTRGRRAGHPVRVPRPSSIGSGARLVAPARLLRCPRFRGLGALFGLVRCLSHGRSAACPARQPGQVGVVGI